MPNQKTRRAIGLLFLLGGASLLVIAAAGQWTSWGRGYGYEKRPWERFNPVLVAQLPDYSALTQSADVQLATGGTHTEAEKMHILYDLMADRFTHDESLHTLSSNWILYLAGFIHPTFRHIWSTNSLVSHGYSLLCDQSSYLLMHLARTHGFKARHVGLQGHVVMEVWYDGDWHLYDPDLEVIPISETGKVLSLDALAQNEPLLQKYYGAHPGDMVGLIRNRENHLYMSTPDGARFEWKANILVVVEKVAEVLKFVIPVLLIGVGLWLRKPPHGKATSIG